MKKSWGISILSLFLFVSCAEMGTSHKESQLKLDEENAIEKGT